MSNIDELIEQLRRKGLSRASTLGCHSSLFDEAADALEKLQSERDRYKSHVERLLSLPDCNTCDSKDRCAYCPDIGAFTRINCPLWRGQKKN